MVLKNLYKYKTLIRLSYKNKDSHENSQNFKETSYEQKVPNFDKEFELKDIFNESNNDEILDKRIKQLCLNNKKDIDSLLLLRCRISHAVLETIRSIWYKENINVSFVDLLSIFLEDNGERFMSSTNNLRKKDFVNYKFVEKLKKVFSLKNERIHPFSLYVIETYKTKNNASIGYWAGFLIKRDNELKKITRPHGQRVLTDWGLLYATSKSRMTNSWKIYGDKSLFLELGIKDESLINKIILTIFKNYHIHYPTAKEFYRRKVKRDTGWIPDSIFLKKLIPEKKPDSTKYDEKIIEKILINIASAIRIESGENLKIETIEKINEENKNSSENENKSKDDFISLSEYIRESSEDEDKKKTNQLDLFIQTLINKISFSETKKIFEISEKDFSSKPELLDSWILLSKNIDFYSISMKTKIDKSTLSKTFKCQEIASNTSDETIYIFKKITFIKRTDVEYFTNKFNSKYEMSNIFNEELALILSNAFKSKNNPLETIFDDYERYNLVFNSIMRFVNPKKGAKLLINKHVNMLLKEKGYL